MPQFRTNLDSGAWLPLTTTVPWTTNGTSVTITDTNAAAGSEFYRIKISTP
jgi:hypothetical protein